MRAAPTPQGSPQTARAGGTASVGVWNGARGGRCKGRTCVHGSRTARLLLSCAHIAKWRWCYLLDSELKRQGRKAGQVSRARGQCRAACHAWLCRGKGVQAQVPGSSWAGCDAQHNTYTYTHIRISGTCTQNTYKTAQTHLGRPHKKPTRDPLCCWCRWLPGWLMWPQSSGKPACTPQSVYNVYV